MITYTDTTCTIKCDKCGHEETASKETYNDQFWKSKWSMNPNGRRYKHKCYSCLNSKQRKTMEWVQENFPICHNK